MAISDSNTPTPIDIKPRRVTENVNPLIGDCPPDTLSACANYVSFLQSYVMDNEDLKNCPTAAGGFFWALGNLHHALRYEYERVPMERIPEPRDHLD